ncbi:MAG: hypothetical protein HY690_05450 [Chloroflexi bacterium]|nr:hypothetical protein [Chloroflexota bacterium]
MPIQRGLAYAAPRSQVDTVAGLVLTNDVWNRKMGVYGVVRLIEPSFPDRLVAPVLDLGLGRPLQALPGQLVLRGAEDLGEALAALDAAVLARVEDGLAVALGFPYLFRDPPAAPPTPAGPMDYPEWGGLYYATSLRVGNEAKRYVVVSINSQNAAKQAVLVVRTTAQTKHPTHGIAFPRIEDGTKHACCGDLTSIMARTLPLQRPFVPQRLSLADMRAIANGLMETHGLAGALARL